MILMRYRAKIAVYLKPGVPDPEGYSVKDYLKDRGYIWIQSVRSGKFWEVTVEAASKEEAGELVERICLDPLANIVKDNYDILELEELR